MSMSHCIIFYSAIFSNILKRLNPQPHPSPPKHGPVYLHAEDKITTLQVRDMNGMRSCKVKFLGPQAVSGKTFGSCDLDGNPMTLIYENDLYPLICISKMK